MPPIPDRDAEDATKPEICSSRPLSWSKNGVWWEETKRLAVLSIPTIIIQSGLFLPQFLTASYVGSTLGVENLDGFTLGNLTSNLMTLSVLQGLFTANDTLNPQAFGAGNYREVGLLAIRGFAVCMLAILPSNVVLFFFMDPIMLFLKQNPITSELATRYYRVLMLGLPFYVLYAMQWKFLAAQEIMKPLLIVTIVACALMPVLLRLFVAWFGFLGAPLSLVAYLALQALLVLLYLVVLKPHHPETWPGLKIKEALQWNSLKPFLVLAGGGMLATCEWWFWEVFSLVIGSFGVIPLSIHTIPTQLLTMVVMIPIGFGLAVSVRIGATISHSVKRAKEIVLWSAVFITVLVSFITLALWVYRKPLILMFSSNPLVVEVSDVNGAVCGGIVDSCSLFFPEGSVAIVVASVCFPLYRRTFLVCGVRCLGFGTAMDGWSRQHGSLVDLLDSRGSLLCRDSRWRVVCGLALSLAALLWHGCLAGVQNRFI